MSWPQHQDPGNRREAKAPYNFVPLPEKVHRVADPPRLDVYHTDDRHTGWLECSLTTASPLYVRCGLRPDQVGKVEAKDLPDFFYTDPDSLAPVIPGSSLRGMLRALVEIVSYSKVQPVGKGAKMTFRAVAAPRNDPLSQPYQNVLGRFGRNVKAGYLERRDGNWFVHPAQHPSGLGLPEQGSYLKVKDKQIPKDAIPDLIRLRESNYSPQYHEVSFDTQVGRGKRGSYVQVTKIGPRGSGGKYDGVLVCSGNMAETGSAAANTPRKNYALVLGRVSRAKELVINAQTVQDYADSLTEFQKEQPFDKRLGCLVEGRPVFYVEERGAVIAFGHSPNFRIPAWLPGTDPKRAATPLDFVPPELYDAQQTDLAEAVFGYVEPQKQTARPGAQAGRICVSDATLEPGQGDVWLSQEPITPRILATPKPTTFQHYLVQPDDDQKQLRHYGSPTPKETVIRGHKLYWHKGNVKRDDFEEQNEVKPNDTQHTKIKPVRSGVRFGSRIHFENLSDVELGALLWLLKLAADDGHRLKLGMGKPLGLGAVKIEATLHLTDRQARYARLFEDGEDAWATGESPDADATWSSAVKEFEGWILNDPHLNSRGLEALKDVERIQMLRFLLSWPGPHPARDKTRYLEIEHDQYGNEYKDRRVLPTPRGVLHGKQADAPLPARRKPKPRVPATPMLKRGQPVQATVTGVWGKGRVPVDLEGGLKANLKVSRKKAPQPGAQLTVVVERKQGKYYLVRMPE